MLSHIWASPVAFAEEKLSDERICLQMTAEEAEDMVEITVSFDTPLPICGFFLRVTFDPDQLIFAGTEACEGLDGLMLSVLSTGEEILLLADGAENCSGQGALFRLSFKYAKDAVEGETVLRLHTISAFQRNGSMLLPEQLSPCELTLRADGRPALISVNFSDGGEEAVLLLDVWTEEGVFAGLAVTVVDMDAGALEAFFLYGTKRKDGYTSCGEIRLSKKGRFCVILQNFSVGRRIGEEERRQLLYLAGGVLYETE